MVGRQTVRPLVKRTFGEPAFSFNADHDSARLAMTSSETELTKYQSQAELARPSRN